MDEQSDELKLRINQINHEWRRLAHAVDASGVALHRALHADSPERRETERQVADESWPRPTNGRSRLPRRAGGVLLLSLFVLLLGTIAQRRWPVAHSDPGDVAPQSTVSHQPAVSVDRPLAREPFVIHVRATGRCRVRVVVDGTVLDWRALQAGDEVLLRPREELLIESDDGGALSATVNGKPVLLGERGHAIAYRLTSEGLSSSSRREEKETPFSPLVDRNQ
ncbi:MAG TPA: DUF4115 domain-containing protein [Vicinamibacterales bacterium]|nr:DUF4115 domain-containing protein [Vicinamibacterales bacterium]